MECSDYAIISKDVIGASLNFYFKKKNEFSSCNRVCLGSHSFHFPI